MEHDGAEGRLIPVELHREAARERDVPASDASKSESCLCCIEGIPDQVRRLCQSGPTAQVLNVFHDIPRIVYREWDEPVPADLPRGASPIDGTGNAEQHSQTAQHPWPNLR